MCSNSTAISSCTLLICIYYYIISCRPVKTKHNASPISLRSSLGVYAGAFFRFRLFFGEVPTRLYLLYVKELMPEYIPCFLVPPVSSDMCSISTAILTFVVYSLLVTFLPINSRIKLIADLGKYGNDIYLSCNKSPVTHVTCLPYLNPPLASTLVFIITPSPHLCQHS